MLICHPDLNKMYFISDHDNPGVETSFEIQIWLITGILLEAVFSKMAANYIKYIPDVIQHFLLYIFMNLFKARFIILRWNLLKKIPHSSMSDFFLVTNIATILKK